MNTFQKEKNRNDFLREKRLIKKWLYINGTLKYSQIVNKCGINGELIWWINECKTYHP